MESYPYIPQLNRVVLNKLSCELLCHTSLEGGQIVLKTNIAVNAPDPTSKELFSVAVSMEAEGYSKEDKKNLEFTASCSMLGYYNYNQKELEWIADKKFAPYIFAMQIFPLVRDKLQNLLSGMDVNTKMPFLEHPWQISKTGKIARLKKAPLKKLKSSTKES